MPVPHRNRPLLEQTHTKPPFYKMTSTKNLQYVTERSKPKKKGSVTTNKKTCKGKTGEKETSIGKENKTGANEKKFVEKRQKAHGKIKESNNQDKCKYCEFLFGEEGDPLIDEE